jgi:hypothetical protein
MSNGIRRRDVVTLIGGAAAGAALVRPARAVTPETAGGTTAKLPWKYVALEPDLTGDRAYASYLKGHCMYGAFESIVGSLGDRLGDPYRSFPFDMFVYGAGGIAGWGTICGALNGAAAAFQLLSPKPEPLVDALFSWYETEALPDYHPKAAKFPDVKVAAGTPLCHESVSRWCAAAKKTTYSPERKDRCGVLTAAVARHAVTLLNAQASGTALPIALDKATQDCMGCHEKGGALENSRGKMGCDSCHFKLGGRHPAI